MIADEKQLQEIKAWAETDLTEELLKFSKEAIRLDEFREFSIEPGTDLPTGNYIIQLFIRWNQLRDKLKPESGYTSSILKFTLIIPRNHEVYDLNDLKFQIRQAFTSLECLSILREFRSEKNKKSTETDGAIMLGSRLKMLFRGLA